MANLLVGNKQKLAVRKVSDSPNRSLRLTQLMSSQPAFQSASPYQDDVLALPVTDLDETSNWYCKHFGMTEVERHQHPVPTVILERDGTRLGFSKNGGASQDGAAIRVTNIQRIKDDLESKGVAVANWRVDERDQHQMNSIRLHFAGFTKSKSGAT